MVKEVYVLGAGFTKAFAPDAPLLVDSYDTPEVKEFDRFPITRDILRQERSRCQRRGHKADLNLERLMTRLAGGTPYDWRSAEKGLLDALLSTLKRALLKKLHDARAAINVHCNDLESFAKHCRHKQISCITFNYDDFLDKALLKPDIREKGWHPDWGYGFYCNSSIVAIGASKDPDPTISRIVCICLLKLHGSVNWWVLHGHPTPYATDAMTHFEDWWTPTGLPETHDEPWAPRVTPYL